MKAGLEGQNKLDNKKITLGNSLHYWLLCVAKKKEKLSPQ